MPPVIPAHVAIRSRLRESVYGDKEHPANCPGALALDQKLELLIAEKPSKPGGGFHGKIDFSQPPWYAPVAHSHLALHALSRKLEREMRAELGLPRRYRGGSSLNTHKALDAVCRLAEGTDDFMVRLSSREIEKWSRRASVALELTELPKRLPRSPGSPEPKCPFCENRTLRAKPLSGMIACINPSCRDEKGKKPEAHMEYSEVIGDWTMIWQDGIGGIPA